MRFNRLLNDSRRLLAAGLATLLRLSVSAGLAIVLLASTAASAGDAAIIGLRQPECALEPMGARPLHRPAEWQGQVVYVDFWASWCRPCVKAFPFMNELQARFGEAGLRVLAVNLDEEAAEAEAFLEKHTASFAMAADPRGRCARAWGVIGMPTSYLIDRSGVVREMYQGFRVGEAARVQQDIEALLAEPSVKAQP
jgi:thiol-disulfide isomerase/thioredoxin